jgi:hypothetical protein
MDARNNIATDLFYKIRSRFRGLKLGAETGQITINPEEARFFDFDYMEGEEPIGHVSISLAEPNSMKVYFSHGITESMDSLQKDHWYGFLKELRQFAKRRLLNFDTRDIAKDNLDKRDYAFLSQYSNPNPASDNAVQTPVGESIMSESAMYGTRTVSYQKLENTRLIIKHSQAVMDDASPGARSRNISGLFVENADGERFKYPFIHLSGARAMQRHVANGGKPYDDLGKGIIGMSEEIAQLKSFGNYVVRNDLMNSDTNGIVERSSEQLNRLRETVAKLSKQAHYEAYKESFQANQPLEVPQDIVEQFKDQFTVKNFKEDIASVFPVLYRLMQENNAVGYDDIVAMTQAAPESTIEEQQIKENENDPFEKFQGWVMSLGEDSAIASNDPEQRQAATQELQELVGQEFPIGVDASNAIESLKGIIEDTKFYQELRMSSKENPEADARPLVQSWLQENAPEVLDQLDFGDMSQEVSAEESNTFEGASEFTNEITIPNPAYDSGESDEEEIEVEVNWHTEGSYYPATREEPAEYPEIIIDSVIDTTTGKNITDDVMGGNIEDMIQDQLGEISQEMRFEDREESSNDEQPDMKALAEFIHTFYDRGTGTFPKGPEGVAILVGKKFGEQAEQVARQFVERMAPQQTSDLTLGELDEADYVNRDEKLKRMGAKPLSTMDKLKIMPRQAKAMARGDSEDDLVNYNKSKATVKEEELLRIKQLAGVQTESDINELDYQSFSGSDELKELRDAIDRNILVSVAFVKKDGTVKHMGIKKTLSSYVPSSREKTDKQANVEQNNDIKKVVDINAYNRNLKELKASGIEEDQAKAEAAKTAWRSINLKNVLGFMARGKFIDLRDENEIQQRFGDDVYGSLTASMKSALAQSQQASESFDTEVAEEKTSDNFTSDDIAALQNIKDIDALKQQAIELISTPSKKPMKPEKIEWFKKAINSKNSKLDIIKLMYDLLLSGEGFGVIGSRSSMSSNSYRQRFRDDVDDIRRLSGL